MRAAHQTPTLIKFEGLKSHLVPWEELEHRLEQLKQQPFLLVIPFDPNVSATRIVTWSKQSTVSVPAFSKTDAARLSSLWQEHGSYISSVRDAQRAIRNGRCYVVNIASQQKLKTWPLDDNRFLQRWMQMPSRYGVYLSDSNFKLASFSPECFFLKRNHEILTQPIKGTYRLVEGETFEQGATHLWSSKKERYELTMTTDLLRNDLNSICLPGTVSVIDPFYIRQTHALLQMQSTVYGQIEPHLTLFQILNRIHPAGSVVGAPKRECLKVIAETEKTPRGYYCGTCFFVDEQGNFDSTILIRSVFQEGTEVYAGAGAGITGLSVPELEAEEVQQKFNSFLSFV